MMIMKMMMMKATVVAIQRCCNNLLSESSSSEINPKPLDSPDLPPATECNSMEKSTLVCFFTSSLKFKSLRAGSGHKCNWFPCFGVATSQFYLFHFRSMVRDEEALALRVE